MAAVTYWDLAQRLDPTDKVAAIIELLKQSNEIMDYIKVKEGNLVTGNKAVIRTGYPTATWRLFNYGVQPDKSETAQITDTTGSLEAYAEVDAAIAELNGNASEFRLSEDRAFLESMNQNMAETFFYGNTNVNPEKFMGLSPRYSALSSDPTKIGSNIIDAGGTGTDNTSIWLTVFGDNTIHGIYPKGSKIGFQHNDKGQVTKVKSDGSMYEVYRTHYKWELGLTVKDWRYAVRIANIDWSNTISGSGPDLVKLMIEAIEMIPNLSMGTPVFSMRREIRTALRNQIRTDSNVQLTVDTVAGKRVVSFDEIPVIRVDQLLSTEARVV